MLFSGVDIKNMEEVVVKYVIETELDGEEERWEEEMWGFEDELSEKMFNEDIFSDVEETGIETKISREHRIFSQAPSEPLRRHTMEERKIYKKELQRKAI